MKEARSRCPPLAADSASLRSAASPPREGHRRTRLPIVNVGDISDADAKAVTIKANTLRGKFDSIELGQIIKDMVDQYDLSTVADDLPFTQERLQGMIDLLDTDPNGQIPDMDEDGDEDGDDGDGGETGKGKKSGEFDSFDPDNMDFDHECPRCHFKFNTKGDGAGTMMEWEDSEIRTRSRQVFSKPFSRVRSKAKNNRAFGLKGGIGREDDEA